MNIRLLGVLTIAFLLIAGCSTTTPAVDNTNTSSVDETTKDDASDSMAGQQNQPDNTEDQDESDISDQQDVSVSQYAEYTNKALGYSLKHPANWYWRHYIENEIGSTHPNVQDFFIASPAPLPGLNSDILGRIVVEVSGQSLQDLATSIEGYAQTKVDIAGIEATRYEGTEDDGLKVIEYHFQNGDKTYRIVYNKVGSSSTDEEPLVELVESFSFDN